MDFRELAKDQKCKSAKLQALCMNVNVYLFKKLMYCLVRQQLQGKLLVLKLFTNKVSLFGGNGSKSNS